jgi:hypothetical protein
MNPTMLRTGPLGRPLALSLLVGGLLTSACSDDPVSAPPADASLVPDTTDASTTEDTPSDDDSTLPAEDTSPIDATTDTLLPDGLDPSDTTPDVDAEPDPDAETDVSIDVEPERSCTTNADCDDGLACTTDRCSAEGTCTWTITATSCFIGGRCVASNASSPSNPCLSCQPTVDRFAWSPRDVGSPCIPADACIVDATCSETSICEGVPLECEDGNDCTVNTCNPSRGCVFTPLDDGTACDDGNTCTVDDTCRAGLCISGESPCDDDDPCTDTSCNADGTCNVTFNTAPCDDGDACTIDSVCDEGVCGGGRTRNCNDGNSCTIDLCDAFVGCVHIPDLNPCCTGTVSVCDDGDPCTTDLCDPETASCAYEFNNALCNDGNACTVNDACDEGVCSGTPRNCDDGNPCTINTCDPIRGCRTEFANGIPCDNGIDCTFDDVCLDGVCTVGRSECVCDPTFASSVVILTSVAIGTGGVPGQGLDVDLNPATCSPRGCSGGIDNALSALAGLANEPLAEAVASGSFALLAELDSLVLNPFRMAVYTGDAVDDTCEPSSGTCSYLVSPSSLDADTCLPIIALPATRAGSRVTANGPDTIFPLEVPFGDATLTLTIFNVRFDGTVVVTDGRLVSLQGILAGAVPKQSLIDAVNALPDDALPLEKSAIIQILNIVVTNDIDSNGDGVRDAASIGIVLAGRGATIAGLGR